VLFFSEFLLEKTFFLVLWLKKKKSSEESEFLFPHMVETQNLAKPLSSKFPAEESPFSGFVTTSQIRDLLLPEVGGIFFGPLRHDPSSPRCADPHTPGFFAVTTQCGDVFSLFGYLVSLTSLSYPFRWDGPSPPSKVPPRARFFWPPFR